MQKLLSGEVRHPREEAHCGSAFMIDTGNTKEMPTGPLPWPLPALPLHVASFVAVFLTTQLEQQTRLCRVSNRFPAGPTVFVELDMQFMFVASMTIWIKSRAYRDAGSTRTRLCQIRKACSASQRLRCGQIGATPAAYLCTGRLRIMTELVRFD